MNVSIEAKKVTYSLYTSKASRVKLEDRTTTVYEYKSGPSQTCNYLKLPNEMKFTLGDQTYTLNDLSWFKMSFVDKKYKPSVVEDANAQNGDVNAGASVPTPALVSDDKWNISLSFSNRLNLAI